MKTRSAAASLALLLASLFLFPAQSHAATLGWFCPKTRFCKPKPPCIKYKCICPQPINPCGLENFGWYRTCWSAWPFPPDYSHCPCPPLGMTTPSSDTSGRSATTKGEEPEPAKEELPPPTKEEPDMTPKGQPEAPPKNQPDANPPKPPEVKGAASPYLSTWR